MTITYRFFVQNTVSPRFKGISSESIYAICNDGEPKKTSSVARSDNAHAAKSKDIEWLEAHAEMWEISKGYFNALKAFIVMGYNSNLKYIVDDAGNVTVSN